jgi:hypothetical protein
VTQRLDRFASHRLADDLRTKIVSGTCPPGNQIPSYWRLRNKKDLDAGESRGVTLLSRLPLEDELR